MCERDREIERRETIDIRRQLRERERDEMWIVDNMDSNEAERETVIARSMCVCDDAREIWMMGSWREILGGQGDICVGGGSRVAKGQGVNKKGMGHDGAEML